MNNIVAYNKVRVDLLLEKNLLPEEYVVDNVTNILNQYKNSFPCVKSVYDRTNSTPHYLKIDPNAYRVPTISEPINKSFYDVARERALELLNTGKQIYVSWSGGIDSTFVLLTLYNLANDKTQIKVYGTYNSVIESGNIFDYYIKDNIGYDIHTNLEYYENFKTPENSIVVTGCVGNDLFYPDLKPTLKDTWMLFQNNTENNIQSYWDKPYQSVLREENLIFLENVISKSPVRIETLQDLRFWINFTFNWSTTNSNRYIGIGPETSSRLYSFFDTEQFQLWAMLNKEPKTKDGIFGDERWQLREYISEYIGKDFAYNKKNYTSVLSNFGNGWLFLLNDYSNIYVD